MLTYYNVLPSPSELGCHVKLPHTELPVNGFLMRKIHNCFYLNIKRDIWISTPYKNRYFCSDSVQFCSTTSVYKISLQVSVGTIVFIRKRKTKVQQPFQSCRCLVCAPYITWLHYFTLLNRWSHCKNTICHVTSVANIRFVMWHHFWNNRHH